MPDNPEVFPKEVYAIARYWGGLGTEITRWGGSQYRLVSEDGMVYLVTPPGAPFAVYHDSGRPEGTVVRDDWAVRCVTDAPDSWFTVSREGAYESWSGRVEQIW